MFEKFEKDFENKNRVEMDVFSPVTGVFFSRVVTYLSELPNRVLIQRLTTPDHFYSGLLNFIKGRFHP